MRNAMSRMQMQISLRTVWCKLGYWVAMCSTRGHVRGRVWLKSEIRERRRREREKFGDFEWIFCKMFDKIGPNVLLHFTSASLRNLFSKALFPCFTSTSLWNLFFPKPSASLHFKIFSRKSAFFPASLSASLLHPPPYPLDTNGRRGCALPISGLTRWLDIADCECKV